MRTGLFFLFAAYLLSQFFRSFLAVMAPVLQQEIGVGAEDLALSSGLWFLSFAVMQLPIGAALDRFGPRRTAAVLLGLGGAGGAAIFATATGPMALHLAMTLIGIGCAPVLMASYFIFARSYPAALFGTLAGAMVGAGSL
ncbi:MAG: MFS transporter, partial [Paracoccaceae bacterium]